MRFRVVCHRWDQWAVEARAAHQGLVARQWLAARRATGVPPDLLAQQRAARVAAGELAFSRADILRAALAEVIDAAGWRRLRWPPIPAGQAEQPGRRWGSFGLEQYDGAVMLDLDDATGDLIRRVAYWTTTHARTRADALTVGDLIRPAIQRAGHGYAPQGLPPTDTTPE